MTLGVLALALAASHNPVLIELYSSEGCSSCPPAEALLRELATQDSSVVALEFHVDYWNGLGWTDRFSSAAYSERQSGYAAARHADQVFTPEAVVDGRASVVGSERLALVAALTKARQHAPVGLSVTPVSGGWSVKSAGAPSGQLWVAVTEAGLETTASRGENRGRRLVHAPVVRSFRTLGNVPAGPLDVQVPLSLDPSWRRSGLRIVAAIQDPQDGAILALGSVEGTQP